MFTLDACFKSIVDTDPSAIVICDTDHVIRYMNPAAYERYKNRGGAGLLGSSLLNCHNAHSNEMIEKVMDWFRRSPENNSMYLYYRENENKDVYMIALRDADGELIGYYEKHKYLTRDIQKPYEGL